MSAATFSDGQRVRCVDDGLTFGLLIEGGIYTITSTVIDEDGEFVRLAELPDVDPIVRAPSQWFASRFEAEP